MKIQIKKVFLAVVAGISLIGVNTVQASLSPSLLEGITKGLLLAYFGCGSVLCLKDAYSAKVLSIGSLVLGQKGSVAVSIIGSLCGLSGVYIIIKDLKLERSLYNNQRSKKLNFE